MKLTIEQTDKILKKLKDSGFKIVEMDECPDWLVQPIISEEYFNEKINETFQEDEKEDKIDNKIYTKLAELCKKKGIELAEFIEDYISKVEAEEIYEYFSTHCRCNNALKEHELESGICSECL